MAFCQCVSIKLYKSTHDEKDKAKLAVHPIHVTKGMIVRCQGFLRFNHFMQLYNHVQTNSKYCSGHKQLQELK